ncbi:MAG: hypothetical protein ACTHJQ_19655 [Rhizobiaceae bacterium]
MRLIRLRAATALLRGAGFVAGVIAGPSLQPQSTAPKSSDPKATSAKTGDLDTTPAGYILLASLVGLAICFFWIWINGRAWR